MSIDQSWKEVIRWGGLSLSVGGLVIVVFILLVFILQQPLPLTGKAVLEEPLRPVILYLLAAVGDSLLMPGALALYFSLKDVKKAPMLIASAFLLLSVPMFLASRGLILSISQMSSSYSAMTNETMKVAYLASAELTIEAALFYGNMALDLLQVGAIILGFAMLNSFFSKRISYVVIVAGVLAFIGSFGVLYEPIGMLALIGLILTAVWQTSVGIRLYKLGKELKLRR